MQIKVFGVSPEMREAIKLIDKFKKINNIKFEFIIYLDLSSQHLGYVTTDRMNMLRINPIRSESPDEARYFNYPRYTTDRSLFGTILHEFSHLMDFKYGIGDEFEKKFPKRFILNEWCHKDAGEELAEILSLYISNPYLLKLLNEDRWYFCRDVFKSPTPTGEKTFIKIYDKYPNRIKSHLKKKWGIYIKSNKVHRTRGTYAKKKENPKH